MSYDFILFGATGFTGRLSLDYILQNPDVTNLKWAVSGRDAKRLEIAYENSKTKVETAKKSGKAARGVVVGKPDFVVIDLQNPKDEVKVKEILLKTKVVLTTAGPFAKYGESLVKLCAETGCDYVDINGESDFVRDMIEAYDQKARDSGSRILMNCGCDCIPWELSFTELNRHIKAIEGEGATIKALRTYAIGVGAPSGGTLDSMFWHACEKPKKQKSILGFDPLLKLEGNKKSSTATKVKMVKGTQFAQEVKDLGMNGYFCTWIMAAVMCNAIRRTNALLGLAPNLHLQDGMIMDGKDSTFVGRILTKMKLFLFGMAFLIPPWRWFLRKFILPKAGSGPSDEVIDAGFMDQYSFADTDKGTYRSKMSFFCDVGYKDTARMMVDSGLCLILDKKKTGKVGAGVTQPAAVLGDSLLKRLTKEKKTTWEVQKVK